MHSLLFVLLLKNLFGFFQSDDYQLLFFRVRFCFCYFDFSPSSMHGMHFFTRPSTASLIVGTASELFCVSYHLFPSMCPKWYLSRCSPLKTLETTILSINYYPDRIIFYLKDQSERICCDCVFKISLYDKTFQVQYKFQLDFLIVLWRVSGAYRHWPC